MPRGDKEAKVREIAERLGKAKAVVLADYRGLSVSEMAGLRAVLRGQGVEFKIYKNTLMRLAARESGMEGLGELLVGPTAAALSYEDALAGAKELSRFSKTSKMLRIKGGLLEGRVLTEAEVKAVASLPSKEQLIATFVGGLQAPLYGLANVLTGPIRGLAMALGAIAAQKEA